MSSLPRRMVRATKRQNGSWVSRERPYRESRRSERGAATGYETLTPTNGWQRVSFKRLSFHRTIAPVGPEEV